MVRPRYSLEKDVKCVNCREKPVLGLTGCWGCREREEQSYKSYNRRESFHGLSSTQACNTRKKTDDLLCVNELPGLRFALQLHTVNIEITRLRVLSPGAFGSLSYDELPDKSVLKDGQTVSRNEDFTFDYQRVVLFRPIMADSEKRLCDIATVAVASPCAVLENRKCTQRDVSEKRENCREPWVGNTRKLLFLLAIMCELRGIEV